MQFAAVNQTNSIILHGNAAISIMHNQSMPISNALQNMYALSLNKQDLLLLKRTTLISV